MKTLKQSSCPLCGKPIVMPTIIPPQDMMAVCNKCWGVLVIEAGGVLRTPTDTEMEEFKKTPFWTKLLGDRLLDQDNRYLREKLDEANRRGKSQA